MTQGLRLVILGVVLGSAAWCRADPAPEFPATWINGGPYKLAGVRGKVVVLWLFDEVSPKAREKWPEVMAVARKYEDKPVLFVAVNSGSPVPIVKNYMASVRCNWPTVIDPDRSFERACNIYSGVGVGGANATVLRIFNVDGQMRGGPDRDIANTIEKYLAAAKWTFDPADVPAALKPAWRLAEFGNLTAALPMLQRAATTGDPATKEGARKLLENIGAVIEQRYAAAVKAEESGKYAAYQLFHQLAAEYKGHPRANDAAAAMKRLEADPQVKVEVKAAAAVEAARVLYRHVDKGKQKQGKSALDEVMKKYPNTEAAAAASKLLNTTPGPGPNDT